MSIKNGKDFLYVIWKDPKSRRQFIIGKLAKNGLYEFSYEYEIDEAIKAGFNALISLMILVKHIIVKIYLAHLQVDYLIKKERTSIKFWISMICLSMIHMNF